MREGRDSHSGCHLEQWVDGEDNQEMGVSHWTLGDVTSVFLPPRLLEPC